MTVRELRDILDDMLACEAINPDAPVLVAGTDDPSGCDLTPVVRYGATRYGTDGRHVGALVPYDEADDSYDEAEGDDSIPVFVLWRES